MQQDYRSKLLCIAIKWCNSRIFKGHKAALKAHGRYESLETARSRYMNPSYLGGLLLWFSGDFIAKTVNSGLPSSLYKVLDRRNPGADTWKILRFDTELFNLKGATARPLEADQLCFVLLWLRSAPHRIFTRTERWSVSVFWSIFCQI